MLFKNFFQNITVHGTVISVDRDKLSFTIQARSGDVFETMVGPTTYYQMLSNLDGLSRNRVPDPEGMDWNADPVRYDFVKYVKPDMPVFVEGIAYLHGSQARFEARAIHLLHSDPKSYLFEETHWWLVQISQMADRWLDHLFDAKRAYEIDDFSSFYRTNLNITGQPTDDTVQECATLSRLIYGLSSAYLLTGAERYFLAAKAGVAYQREAFRSLSHDGRHCFWAYGRRRTKEGEVLIIPSQNDDDRDAVPLYEQIYALAGLTQYYRITLDWEVLEDIRRTVNTFQDFYWDNKAANADYPGLGGYFSHLDYATLRPDAPALGRNQSRKNWNSIGDHIPAYMITLIQALDPLPKVPGKMQMDAFLETCRDLLEETATLIIEKFPDSSSDYVNERFFADWSPDHHWGWQQNRAIVGHNLKISWNLTRCAFYFQVREKELRERRRDADANHYRALSEKALAVARKLARDMAEVGIDKIRGGIFDAVERQPTNGMPTQFAWNITKDFWQQEQGILAYLILHGADSKDQEFLALARECTAFWNLYFLDRDRQGIFFRTTASGLPFLLGSYANKGGHSISGYHAFELNYLAHLYMRAYVATGNKDDNNFCLYFKLSGNRDQQSINVLPDFFPPGALEIRSVRIDGIDCTDEVRPHDPDNFQIELGADLACREAEIVVEFGVPRA
jgi:mannose/cellobiose epimerase-like protein (N-acyl-D-glucosamine 2-epimerase family)